MPAGHGAPTPVKTFSAAPQQCIDPSKTYTATIATDHGDIVIALDPAQAPGTVNNFVTLARYGYYDDTTIFRSAQSIDIIQGGGNSPSDQFGYTIPDEGSSWTYPPGKIAMANTGAPNSGGAQWFITTGPNAAKLDAQGTYTVFGDVTSGLDVAQEIAALATSATDDSMKEKVVVDQHRDRRELTASGLALVAIYRRREPELATTPLESYGRSPWTTGSPTSSQPVTPRSNADPVGSSTTGVFASVSVRWRRSSLHVLHAGDDGDAARPGRGRG